MSQSGYGHGPPSGWQPQNPFGMLPPTYGAPSYQPADALHPQYPSHNNVAAESYEYNRNAIPGLAHFQQNITHWQQQPWLDGTNPLPPIPIPVPPPPGATRDERPSIPDANVGQGKIPPRVQETSEEGEISEGELEDLYEPRQEGTRDDRGPGSAPTRSGLPPSGSKEGANQQSGGEARVQRDAPSQRWEPGSSTRERSRSYSPYLSPREIQSNGVEHPVSKTTNTPRTEIDRGDMQMPDTGVPKRGQDAIQPPDAGKAASAAVAEARKKAKDAILRLWPLNIRYQNYLDEGVEKELLDSLFAELGLDRTAPKLLPKQPDVARPKKPDVTRPKQPDATRPKKAPERPAPSAGAKAETKTPEKPRDTADATEKPAQKGEERKDRIARLLAAKSSKSSKGNAEKAAVDTVKSVAVPETAPKTAPKTTPKATPKTTPKAVPTSAPKIVAAPRAATPKPAPDTAVPQTVPQTAAQTAPRSATPQSTTPQTTEPQTAELPTVEPETMLPKAPSLTKSQSEKSKLIQQKMEALKRQREASKSVQPQASATPATETSGPQASRPSSPDVNERSLSSAPEPMAALVQPSEQPREAHEASDANGAATIPGLFLSSTPQPSQIVNERKRPIAADLNEFSDAGAQKRPFGHKKQSRPFLIDVSDDEDDAEMDIDSPDEDFTPIRRPSTPMRTASFRDHPALPDHVSHRQLASPQTAGTPSGYSSGIDLENMNKQIEDMKRKIAEAEARKKSKQSSNGSPSLPHSQNESKEGSAEATSPVEAISEAAAALRAELRTASQPAPASEPTSPAPLRLPKVRNERGRPRPSARARVASERLPVIEAHRKNKMLQLKRLQDEVARIEREIRDSLEEEEQLREEAADSEPFELARGSESDGMSTEPPAEPLSPKAPSEKHVEAASPTQQAPVANGQVPGTEAANAYHVTENGTAGSSRAETEDVPDIAQDATTVQAEADAVTQAETSANEAISVNDVLTPGGVVGQVNQADAESDVDSDVAMDEAEDSSSEGQESLDEYEPTEEGVALPNGGSVAEATRNEDGSDEDGVLGTDDTDLQGVSTISPVVQPISGAEGEPESPSEPRRETEPTPRPSEVSKSTFVPYETPLHCFHAYRFHPEFKDTVAGGLRSVTYSNMIDASREVCPDELTGGVCPRGDQCEFQHFEKMKTPDDQILLQLGNYSNFEGDQQQQYIEGLRALLTDFRNRKVKDFQTIGDGIIEYRAKFQGDKTKILPLGNVAP